MCEDTMLLHLFPNLGPSLREAGFLMTEEDGLFPVWDGIRNRRHLKGAGVIVIAAMEPVIKPILLKALTRKQFTGCKRPSLRSGCRRREMPKDAEIVATSRRVTRRRIGRT